MGNGIDDTVIQSMISKYIESIDVVIHTEHNCLTGMCRPQQAGSLEDVAKSTPSSDPSMSEDHQHFGTGSSLANSSTFMMSSSTTPSSATEAEETE